MTPQRGAEQQNRPKEEFHPRERRQGPGERQGHGCRECMKGTWPSYDETRRLGQMARGAKADHRHTDHDIGCCTLSPNPQVGKGAAIQGLGA